MAWQTNDDGSKTCADHGETFRAPAACPQCEESDADDDTSTVNDTFPRLHAQLTKAAAHHLEMHRRFLDRENAAFEAANFTAGAAYGRLALSSLTAACERLEKIAERLDIDGMRRSRSRVASRAKASERGVQ